MNDLKGIRDDIEKSTLISEKVLGKIVELIGENTYQLLEDEHSDIMTTTGELAITLRNLERLEEENEQLKKDIIEIEKVSDFRWEENQRLKAQIEKMKNHQNCKHRKTWGTADIMEDELKSPCDKCKDYDKWELAE